MIASASARRRVPQHLSRACVKYFATQSMRRRDAMQEHSSPAHFPHFLSFVRNSAKKFSTTTTVGVPAISPHLLSRTMRNR